MWNLNKQIVQKRRTRTGNMDFSVQRNHKECVTLTHTQGVCWPAEPHSSHSDGGCPLWCVCVTLNLHWRFTCQSFLLISFMANIHPPSCSVSHLFTKSVGRLIAAVSLITSVEQMDMNPHDLFSSYLWRLLLSPAGGRFKKEIVVDGQSHLLLIRDEGGPPEAQVGTATVILF